jgi:hypothetical protein
MATKTKTKAKTNPVGHWHSPAKSKTRGKSDSLVEAARTALLCYGVSSFAELETGENPTNTVCCSNCGDWRPLVRIGEEMVCMECALSDKTLSRKHAKLNPHLR